MGVVAVMQHTYAIKDGYDGTPVCLGRVPRGHEIEGTVAARATEFTNNSYPHKCWVRHGKIHLVGTGKRRVCHAKLTVAVRFKPRASKGPRR